MTGVQTCALPIYPTFLATNYVGAVDAVQYLIDLNHRQIAYITGRPGIQNTDRLNAYMDCLDKNHIPFDANLVVEGDFSTRGGYLAAGDLLTRTNRPTAIFASNDQTAFGVMHRAKELGLRIPQDLSVVGFDNISESEYLDLTTIDQSLMNMGTMAAEMLIDLINHKEVENKVITIPTRMVVRGSCQAL